MRIQTHVDIAFPVRGRPIPRDHAYALYAAISRVLPTAHGAAWLALQGVSGKLAGPEELSLEPTGTLRLRAPAERLSELIVLAGATIEVAGRELAIGAPTVHPLVPVAALDARLVVIRFTDGLTKPFDRAVFDKRFVDEAQRQLTERGIRGDLELCGRRSLRVAGQRILGHSVRVIGLSPEDSLKLQTHGLGGKRSMGCGIFRAARIMQRVMQVA